MPDRLFMQRCFDLALRGIGNVAPNPMVGAIIVCQDKILGEGFHKQFGQSHAEVNAINNAIENGFGNLLEQSTIYVNLEPCSHFGKTPPCCDLIIKHNFKKVVISNVDPNPIVAGKGIAKIIAAGIEVTAGILENEGEKLNQRFFTFHRKKRPYIILKYAQTKNGFISLENPNSETRKISNELSNKLVHQWRSEESGIMVGTNTAMIDNPSLTVRHFKGKNPIRLVIDKDCKIPLSFIIFNSEAPTLVFNSLKNEMNDHIEYCKIDFSKEILAQILEICYLKNIQSIFVEGGQNLHQQFIDLKFWDEIRVITADFEFQSGTKAAQFTGNLIDEFQLANDIIRIFHPSN